MKAEERCGRTDSARGAGAQRRDWGNGKLLVAWVGTGVCFGAGALSVRRMKARDVFFCAEGEQ